MGEKSLQEKNYTVEEYLELLKNSEEKLEYENGRVFAMAGGLRSHSRIISNTFGTLLTALPKGCTVNTSDLGIYIDDHERYTFPDLSVSCDTEELERNMFLKNPKLIVEVSSKSTEKYDNTTKMLKYFSLPSLLEYMLVQADRPIVVLYSRNEKGVFEVFGTIGINFEVYLPNFKLHLPMQEIYDRVTGLQETDLL